MNHICNKELSNVFCWYHREPFRSIAPKGILEFVNVSNSILCQHTTFWMADCNQDQEKYDQLLEERPICCRLADYGLLIPAYDLTCYEVGKTLWGAGSCAICKSKQPCVFPVEMSFPGLIRDLGPKKGQVDLICFLCYLGYRERITYRNAPNDHPYKPSTN